MTTPMPNYGIDSNDNISTLFDTEYYANHFMSKVLSDPNYDHDLSAARLWAVKQDNTYHLIDVSPDIYNLLDTEYKLESYHATIVHTTGWAAPLNPDGTTDTAPSQHDQRKRVSLVVCVNDKGISSALAFSGESEIIHDNGTATGSLSEALVSFWEKNRI